MGYTHHDGLAVYGSGIAVGKKPSETRIMDKSGQMYPYAIYDHAGGVNVINASGMIQPNTIIPNATHTAGIKWDYGRVGGSGWLHKAVSTAVSSIAWATATVYLPLVAAQTGMTGASGFPSTIFAQWSGHAMDFHVLTSVSAPGGTYGDLTSCGVSTQIAWMAWGT